MGDIYDPVDYAIRTVEEAFWPFKPKSPVVFWSYEEWYLDNATRITIEVGNLPKTHIWLTWNERRALDPTEITTKIALEAFKKIRYTRWVEPEPNIILGEN